MDAAEERRTSRVAAAIGLLFVLGVGTTYLLSSSPEPPASSSLPADKSRTAEFGNPGGLPLPSTVSPSAFEEKLFEFLNTRQYVKLGWRVDKGVRDTGPFIDGKYFGTHPAVRVYYSPGVIRWLQDGRVGKIPDGEMIVKEQFKAPAERHRGKTEEELWDSLESWTVMVKDSSGSHDGWFWSNPVKGQCSTDPHRYPFDYPASGFGQYCVRCHAATHTPGTKPADSANEFTFASLRNIAGFPGTPLEFRVDASWREPLDKGQTTAASSKHPSHDSHPKCARPKTPERPTHHVNAEFLRTYKSIKPVDIAEVSHLPPVSHDWVVSNRDPAQEFITSNQCMSCHAGLVAPFGPSMFVPAGKSTDYGAPGWDISPYGEWKWTPMALAGRDPIFYAQVESEMREMRAHFRSSPELASRLSKTVADTCLRCHGAMGKKQFDVDHPDGSTKFNPGHILAAADPKSHPGHGDAKYGALARDGVSCTVCHRMQPKVQPDDDKRPYLQYFLETSITGNFHLGKKGEIYGPFKDNEIAPYVMEHATGLKPKHSAFLQSSQMCGTCHTVSLPNIDQPMVTRYTEQPLDELSKSEVVPAFRAFHHHVEQATYLEWLNSEFENEVNKNNPLARSCQDCHMSRGLKDERHALDLPRLRTRIAAIQDATYPDAENLAAPDQLLVRMREEGYRRHNFSGLNMFLLEMFNQFDDVLGVSKLNFMTGSKDDVGNAVNNFVRTARNDVASLDVKAEWDHTRRVTARVLVKNKVGHRFPSGVGFRRAFLELSVVKRSQGPHDKDRVLWASGRTNDLGVLLGADGQPLPSEFFARDAQSGRQVYQKHHEVITSQDQVQVYETLLRDASGKFTTSFIRGCEIVKDNRLLPRGWKREGPGPALTGRFLEATYPDPETARDPQYQDGSGTDEVVYRMQLPADVEPADVEIRATLYYQAIPPYFLRELFENAPDGEATRRLHYLCSHIDLKGTPIENWKLRVAGAACGVSRRP